MAGCISALLMIYEMSTQATQSLKQTVGYLFPNTFNSYALHPLKKTTSLHNVEVGTAWVYFLALCFIIPWPFGPLMVVSDMACNFFGN